MKTRTYLHSFTAVFCIRAGRIALLVLAFSLLLCSHSIPVRALPGDLSLAWSSNEVVFGYSVAWGDWDGDGDLDLAVGNENSEQSNWVYRNDGGSLAPAWSSDETDNTRSVAWGDWDGDGDLDLAIGNDGQPNRVYENISGTLLFTPTLGIGWESAETDWTTSVAWGDWEGDGDLDLAVGNGEYMSGQPNRVYENISGTLLFAPTLGIGWSSPESDHTYSVAWGDWEGDGDLDLAVGNSFGYHNRVYENISGTLLFTPTLGIGWSSPESDYTYSVAWGDWEGDGDLDLAVGNVLGQPNRVYRNDGGTLALAWSSDETNNTHSVAWGDWDGDGDLDLAVGNGSHYQSNQVYRNVGGTLALAWSSDEVDNTHSVAWGDWDGDGDLDLAAGNHEQSTRVYENEGGSLAPTWSWSTQDNTRSVAWGDWDGDGDLDLAIGNDGQPNRVYENISGTLLFTPTLGIGWESAEADNTTSAAWGDVDGDGDLDLAIGNDGQPNRVYRNDGGTLALAWSSDETDNTRSVAWGDWDGDGDLDLAVGNYNQPNLVYENISGTLLFTPTLGIGWESAEMDGSTSAAWGDVDGDGDLDLAVGNDGQVNRVYRNAGGSLALAWSSDETDNTRSVAWGDWDGDGDLDLAVGNGEHSEGQPNRIYRNTGGSLALAWSSTEWDRTFSVAWGDWNGDGDLDLAVGNVGRSNGPGRPNRVYESAGGSLALAWSSTEWDHTRSVAWGDWDGDGDLDLAVGNWSPYGINRVYGGCAADMPPLPDMPTKANIAYPGPAAAPFFASATVFEGPTVPITYTLFDPEGDPARFVRAYYSIDGGGDWRPAVAASGTVTTNLASGRMMRAAHVYSPTQPIPNGTEVLSATMVTTETGEIADLDVWLSISHTQNADLAAVLVSPSGITVTLVNSGTLTGSGLIGTVFDDQATMPLISGTPPYTRTYRPAGSLAAFNDEATISGTWTLLIIDTASNGYTGTLSAWGLRIKTPPATHVYTWDIWGSGVLGVSQGTLFRLDVYQGFTGPGPYQHPSRIAQTLPFRVRGSQVQVLSGTVPAEGAVVYRLPTGYSGLYRPYRDSLGLPFRTSSDGYLQGRGEIGLGDQLVALLPISATDGYTLYYTNARPLTTGLEAYTVTAWGVQTLTVSADYPLLLFDLDVSLEWDARNDDLFMAQLEYDLQRASALLYDWTDGQAALGNVTVYHDRELWNEADVRVYATNRLRPSAAQGGISGDVISDTDVLTLTYGPGQVHIGAVWNRYGEPGGGIGDDWPRTLAHELGHYALFLDDNYLGLDESGLVIPVAGCTGAMSDPYREDYPYDEFHAADGWLPACEQTLSHQATGRSDWQTIETFYPWLGGSPNDAGAGPSALPLAVTQVEMVEPVTPATTLADPTFYLVDEWGTQVQPGSSARAFLFQEGRVTDLGRPVLDRVVARGARVGDRLCVYELAAGRLGCEEIATGDEQLELAAVAGWQPNLVISPVTSRTIEITVTNVEPGLAVQGRLYPLSGLATDAITLTETGGVYAGVFTATEPALAGYVHVWVDETEPRREVVTDYALGGSPAGSHAFRGGFQRNRQAPAVSADGQVILFGDMDFDEGEFFTLQAATVVRGVPEWMAAVGQAYRLVGSANAPDLTGASISFAYLGSEVPSGQEVWIQVYYQAPMSTTWQMLPTRLDTYHNTASAPVAGVGMYVLMTSVEIPIYAPGWNMVAYPVPGTRPVEEALASISGAYGMVYGYESTDPADPWKLYAPAVPEWVNDLQELEFGHGYWISMTQPITLHLRGADYDSSDGAAATIPLPPATFYGRVEPGPGFTPTAGMTVTTVTAWINGNLCGQGVLTDVAGYGVAYTIDVMADDGGAWAGCGAPGREVVFRVGSQEMVPAVLWSNDRVWELALRPPARIYLPLVLKD